MPVSGGRSALITGLTNPPLAVGADRRLCLAREGDEPLGMTRHEGDTEREIIAGRLLAAAATAAAIGLAVLLVHIARARGPWLDEFWSIWAITPSAARQPLLERWLSDVHPVIWPILTWVTGDLLGDDMASRRLAANGLALLATLAGAAVLWRARPANGAFLFLFLTAVLGTPIVALGFGDYRPYFAHICAFSLALAFWVHVQQDVRDYDRRRDRAPFVVGAMGIFLSLTFHYVGAFIASIAIAFLILILALQKRRGWALRVGAAAGAGWLFMLLMVALQYPRWQSYLDVRWIKTPPEHAWLIELYMIVFPFYFTPAMALVAFAGWRINLGAGSEVRRIVLPFVATIVISGGLLYAANLRTPIIVDRYLLLWIPLLCGTVAAMGAPVFDARWMAPALLAMLAVSGIRTARLPERLPSWADGTARVAARVRACPATRVYWMSSWQMGDDRDSRAGRRELQAFGLGYARQARAAGFTAQPLPEDERIDVRGAACPTLVWLEHAPTPPFPDTQTFLDASRIRITGLPAGERPVLHQHRAAKILVIPPGMPASPAQ